MVRSQRVDSNSRHKPVMTNAPDSDVSSGRRLGARRVRGGGGERVEAQTGGGEKGSVVPCGPTEYFDVPTGLCSVCSDICNNRQADLNPCIKDCPSQSSTFLMLILNFDSLDIHPQDCYSIAVRIAIL